MTQKVLKHNNKCDKPARGDIVVGFGKHVIAVELEGEPCVVRLSIRTPADAIPVCFGDVNRIKVTVKDDGFVIEADIRTNTCRIDWVCEF